MQIRKQWKKGIALLLTAVFTVSLFAGCGTQYASDQTWGRADAKEIDINSKISGRVVSLLVKEGDKVQKGQVLARIDERDLVAQRAEAVANLESIKAQQVQARFTTDMQSGTTQSALGQAQANRDKAQANMELARVTFNRYQGLLAAGAISRQTYDQEKSTYDQAVAAYNQTLQAVSQAESGLMQTDVNKANETALLRRKEQAEAALRQIEVNLDETIIRAPFDGIITEKYVEEGSMISTGTPLVAVQDPTDNWVDIKVPETELSGYHLHDKVTLTARDDKTQVTGEITDISRKADFATQRATSERGKDTDIITFNVKIQINDTRIRPGMRFRITGSERA